MAGLPWFERDVDLHENPKVRALQSRLREPLADAYVDRVYAYCYRQGTDRFDVAVAAETLEKAVEWRGRRGFFFDAFFACGFLERDAGKVIVHGVAERLAPHLAKRLGDAERQRRRREKAAASIERPPDVTRDITRDEAVSHGGTGTRTETENNSTLAPAYGLDRQRAQWAAAHPVCAALLETLKAGGLVLTPSRKAEVTEQIEAATQRLGYDRAAAIVRAEHEADPNGSIGWYVRALHRAASQPFAAPVPDPAAGCPEAAPVFAALQARTDPKTFDDWMRPLKPECVNGHVLLRAPSDFHAGIVRERFGSVLAEVGAEVAA